MTTCKSLDSQSFGIQIVTCKRQHTSSWFLEFSTGEKIELSSNNADHNRVEADLVNSMVNVLIFHIERGKLEDQVDRQYMPGGDSIKLFQELRNNKQYTSRPPRN